MAGKISGENLFSNTQYGLQRVYSIINKTDFNGVSLTDIEESLNTLNVNDIPFAQYLYQNIGQFDKDSDSVISIEEIQNNLSAISKEGLSYEQLLALQENYGYNLAEADSALSKLIEHFKEIDKNNDGKITESEIKGYNLEQEIAEKKTELKDFKTGNISIFYDDSLNSIEISDGATL